MRLTSYKEEEEDIVLVDDYLKEKDIPKNIFYTFGIYFDTIGLLQIDYNQFISFHEMFSNCMANGFLQQATSIIELRNSFMRLYNTPFFTELRYNYNYSMEEKSRFLLDIVYKVIEKIAPELNSMSGPRNPEDKNKKPDNRESGGEDTESQQDEKDAQAKEQLQAASKVISALADIAELVSTPEDAEKNPSSKSSSKGSAGSIEKYMDKQYNIDMLLRYQNLDDFLKLVSSFKHTLEGKDSNQEIPSPIGEMKFRKMGSYRDIKYLRKQDWALDDDIFDANLVKKNFIIERPVTRRKNFNLYILADVSGSMGGLRDFFLRSFLVAIGRRALDLKSKLSVVFFSDNISQTITLKGNWPEWLQKVLTYHDGGGTEINSAVQRAYTDIKDEELIVITDATISNFPTNREDIPKKALILGYNGSKEDSDIKAFTEYFDGVLISDTKNIEEARKTGISLINII